jgi:gas vesicle protein
MQKLIFVFATLLFLAACNSAPAGNVNLNNGEKWAVNAEMKPHIEQGSKLLNDYLAQQGADHKKLAADLKAQNEQLIKSCTMKGESHDELHKWLHPHMALVENLSEATDPKQAETIVAQLEQSFKTYKNHFK